jgi:hypothetical protein
LRRPLFETRPFAYALLWKIGPMADRLNSTPTSGDA